MIEEIRVGMNGVAPTAVRAVRAERTIGGRSVAAIEWETVRRALQDEIAPPADLIYSEQYKRQLATVLLRRAFDAALVRRSMQGSAP
jgi:CO/xanthine dehydrogenase FAD-binding subunit